MSQTQRNLNGYRWPRMDGQTAHVSPKTQRNFYWNQRNDSALGDDRYVNFTDREDIQGSWLEPALDTDRRTYTGVGPRGYQRSDARIREDVCEQLMSSAEVDPREIEVFVNQGVVFLRGKVTDRRMKRDAELLVDGVRGVIDVMNELSVEGQSEGQTED